MEIIKKQCEFQAYIKPEIRLIKIRQRNVICGSTPVEGAEYNVNEGEWEEQ